MHKGVLMESKSIFKSKTFWANTIALAASVATAMGVDIGPDVQASLVGGVMAVVNIALRFVTNKPVNIS